MPDDVMPEPRHFGAFDVPFAAMQARTDGHHQVDTMIVAYLAEERAKTRPGADLKALAVEVIHEMTKEQDDAR